MCLDPKTRQPAGDCTDQIAAFLIGAGPGHYFGLGSWTERKNGANATDFEAHWSPLFGKPLGSPVAPGAYDGASGVWSRKFGRGAEVRFDARANRGEIRWGYL